jgi:UV DNA damage endonuclease
VNPDLPPRQPPPNLGLVCITHSQAVRYRTLTLSRYKYLPQGERPRVLENLYRHNLEVLRKALHFCAGKEIRLYRVTSVLLPLSDLADGVGESILETLTAELAGVGRLASQLGIRMVIHPDQYVVLSSDAGAVVENSIRVLEHHAWVFDLFGLPRSPWAAINIHGGKAGKAEQLVRVIGQLAAGVRSRLCLENDERAYGAGEILEVCQRSGVPMIFDAHHHVVKERLGGFDDPSIAELVRLACLTWPDPSWQIVHLSNGRRGPQDSAHHDLVLEVPPSYHTVPWIEVEAKGKEVAIAHLQTYWPGSRVLEPAR